MSQICHKGGIKDKKKITNSVGGTGADTKNLPS